MHIKTRCMASFSTSHDNPPHPDEYTENPSTTRAASDHRRRHVMGGDYWRIEETSSSGAYGKVNMTPSLPPDFGTWACGTYNKDPMKPLLYL